MTITWAGLKDDLVKAAPVLGTLIGGPAGGAIGALVASTLGTPNDPAAVQQALATNPDAAIKLRQLEADQAVKLQALAITAEQNRLMVDTQGMQSVNATMQTEAKSDHWPSYLWRPFNGFCVGIMVLGDYFIIPLLHQWFPQIVPPTIPPEAWMMEGAILGVASYFRGKMQADPAVPSDNRG